MFWMVSDSVSKKFGIEKSIGFGIENNLVSKKVSDSVLEIFGIEKSIGFGIEKKLALKKVSDSVSKKFGIEKSIGFGIGNIWYRKKSRIRYRKKIITKFLDLSI
jgi:hypothetical protein